MISIHVSVTDGASQELRNLIAGLTGSGLERLNEAGGRAATVAATAYHREFDASGGWKGSRYMGTGRTGGSSFGANVAAGWHFVSASDKGAIIANNAEYYAFKVKGGTIVPKRAKFLTVPLIAEARGLRAADFALENGVKLFIPRGSHVLAARLAGTTVGRRGRRGSAGSTAIKTSSISAVYALVRSVTMGPWPNAVPDSDMLATAFAERWKSELALLIDT